MFTTVALSILYEVYKRLTETDDGDELTCKATTQTGSCNIVTGSDETCQHHS